jgi:ubiquinone biosynthesis protein UbiJ
MIEQLTTAAAVSVLNRMLMRESWACERLAPFAGRVARFEALPFALSLKIDDGGRFADAERGEAVVTVGLDLASLPLALSDPQAALRDVSLKGDADFAQALAFVLQNLRPEPEEELSRFVGDVVAQRIVGLMRLSASYWRQLAERMLDSGAHYVVSENPMVVGRDEVEEFNAAVARMRDDVARLEKRVELQERAR